MIWHRCRWDHEWPGTEGRLCPVCNFRSVKSFERQNYYERLRLPEEDYHFSKGDEIRCVCDYPHNGRSSPSLEIGKVYEVSEFVEPCDVRLTHYSLDHLLWDARRFEPVVETDGDT